MSIVPPTGFPKGFLWTATAVEHAPDCYEPNPILPGLYTAPDLRVDHASNESGMCIVVLGTAIPSTESGTTLRTAEALLKQLEQGLDGFFALLGQVVGRFVVFFNDGRTTRVAGDAAASRSVFYSDDFSVIASHAALAAAQASHPPDPDSIPFLFGYPGFRTPHTGIRILTANTYIDTRSQRIQRYWPRMELPHIEVEHAASKMLARTTAVMRHIGSFGPFRISLTAGLDSRFLLAAAVASGAPFEAFTYGSGRDTAIDRAVAQHLAARCGVRHMSLPQQKLSRTFVDAVERINYSPSTSTALPALSQWFEDSSQYNLGANLLEIGYMNYAPHRGTLHPPTNAAAMARLHWSSQGDRTRKAIADFGSVRYRQISERLFSEFASTTDFSQAVERISPWNAFYWEHRMSTWFGPAMLERDIYSEALIPFNSHDIYETMLSVTADARDSAAVLHAAIRQAAPALMEVPINPTSWPV